MINQVLCIALFTLAISAGCRGFMSISDWLHSYKEELLAMFYPAKNRLPSGVIELGLQRI